MPSFERPLTALVSFSYLHFRKTLVMSHVIAKHGRPTLVLCHNKTLAAQLARELRSFLGKNAVELFVSYYNHCK